MNIMKLLASVLILTFLVSCEKSENPDPAPVETTYFPPVSGTEWQTTSPGSLGWSENSLNDLYTYLQTKNTKAFIILKNGRIVAEKYFGNFTADSNWY